MTISTLNRIAAHRKNFLKRQFIRMKLNFSLPQKYKTTFEIETIKNYLSMQMKIEKSGHIFQNC